MVKSKIFNDEPLNDSFLDVPENHSCCFRLLKKFDVFSFVPFPKNQPVTTKKSIFGSILFLIIILAYIIVDFVAFVTYNPPSIQAYFTKLADGEYQLPSFAINFMEGQDLNQGGLFDEYFSFALTKEAKGKNKTDKDPVALNINENNNLTWLDNETQQFYQKLRYPSQLMYAKGLLYSTALTNYSKITVKLCDLNDPQVNCKPYENISRLCAQGRIFLFLEIDDDTSVLGDLTNYGANRFKLYNIFLIPQIYKRITVEYQVVKTTVEADWFYRFTEQQSTRLQIKSVTQQTSNTSINAIDQGNISLQLLGITFQLSGEVQNVKATYDTILDRAAKWGAFANLIFAIFCVFFLTYNRKKFYERHPDWQKFKKQSDKEKKQNLLHEQ